MYTNNLGKLNNVNLRNTVCDGDVLVTKIDLGLNDPLKDAVFTGLSCQMFTSSKTQDLWCVFIKHAPLYAHVFLEWQSNLTQGNSWG